MSGLLRRRFEYKFSRFTLVLILINFAVFGLGWLFPDLGFRIQVYGSMNPKLVLIKKFYWQFATYMFVHHDVSHVVCNMLGLLIFGLSLERALGTREFKLFYFFCGISSGLLSFAYYCITGSYNVFLLGASGAVYAVMFGYAVCYPKSIIYIWGIIPVPAPVLVLIYTLIELFSGLVNRGSNVAHYCHLFGFFSAWLYFVVRIGVHPIKVWKKSYE